MRASLPARTPFPYGWVILAAGAFGSFMTVPAQTSGVSVFLDPMLPEFGISRSWASTAYATATLAGILPAPIVGRWIDRRGARITGAVIAAAPALACLFMASIQSGWTLFLGFALLRGTAVGGLSLVSQQVVNLWFVHRRGIAAATATPFRARPETRGLTPDAGLASAATHAPQEPSFTRQEALRTGAFWLLCAAGFLTHAVGTALLLNHFAIPQAAGVGRAAVLTLLSLLAGIQAAVTVGTGALLDRREPRRLVPVAMLLLAMASALPALGTGIAASAVYALGLGGASGAQQAVNAAGFAQYFGRDHLGAIRGWSSILAVAGAALGPLPFTTCIDLTGRDTGALIGGCVLSLACGAAALAVRRPHAPMAHAP